MLVTDLAGGLYIRRSGGSDGDKDVEDEDYDVTGTGDDSGRKAD